MTREEYEAKRKSLETEAAEAKKVYVHARSTYDGICEDLRNLRIDWNEQQHSQSTGAQ